ncbi:hypothetical protein FRC17_009820 [Serendipita sp. 399]|nr:hypothetical protein FRC17_009820 [Serendipita sp. 399]
MFRKKVKGNPDLSLNVKDDVIWSSDLHERFSLARVTAIAHDSNLGIYMCGLSNGEVHLYGSAPVHHAFATPDATPVSHLQIASTAKRVIGIANHRLVVWNLDGQLLRNALTSVEIPAGTAFLGASSRHSHTFIPHPDGTITAFDLSRLCMSPSKVIPIPDLSGDVVMDLVHNLHNLDELLIATYSSIYMWHFASKTCGRTFRLTEQRPFHPVCLSMHPGESIFAAGTLDGRLVFWSLSESEPLWLTTVSELLGELREGEAEERSLEPIFKLSWSLLENGSCLTVLGGRSRDQSRLTAFVFSTAPFSTLEQLVPDNTIIFDPSLCDDIDDFVGMSQPNQVLVLKKSGSVLPIRAGDRTDSGEPLLPYQFRPCILTGYVIHCPPDMPPRFTEREEGESIATGGLALPHLTKGGSDARLSKYDPPRLLVGLHEDRILRFDDASSKLLLSEGLLESPYPTPLPSLAIDINAILEEPLVFASLDDASACEVQRFEFIPTSLEVYVLFKSGEIIVWKWLHERVTSSDDKGVEDSRLIDISSLTNENARFQPRTLINFRAGPVSLFSASEVGFVAISYVKGSFLLIDMRGPTVMNEQVIPAAESISIMKFVVCKQDEKSHRKLFLALFRVSGSITLLPIVKKDTRWVVGERIDIPSRKGLIHSIESFLIDIMTGEDMTATPQSVGNLLSHDDNDTKHTSSISLSEFYRVTVSPDMTSCHIGWSSKVISSAPHPKTSGAGLLRHKDSTVLASYRTDGSVAILSIPKLEVIIQLENVIAPAAVPTIRTMSNLCSFSICTPTGVEVWSLSSSVKKFFPSIMVPMDTRAEDEGGIVSWLFGSKKNMTGDEFDTLVAGPNRPPLPTPTQAEGSMGTFHDTMAAMHERGELTKTLADRTEDLERHAGTMAEQAKRLAAKEKRSKFGF